MMLRHLRYVLLSGPLGRLYMVRLALISCILMGIWSHEWFTAGSVAAMARVYAQGESPPDVAAVERLLASDNEEEALSQLKLQLRSVKSHLGVPDFAAVVARLAHVTARIAEETGDYPGLLTAWAGYSRSTDKKLIAAGRLGMGAVYAAGAGAFPEWRNQARRNLSAVVELVPFSPMARAARDIGARYNVPVVRFPIWLSAAIWAFVMVVLGIAGWRIARSRGPRLGGMITIESLKGEFPLAMFDLARSAGPGSGIIFYMDSGRLKGKPVSVTSVQFQALRDQGRSPYCHALIAAFPTSEGYGALWLWVSEAGCVRYPSGRSDMFQNESDICIEGDCRIICDSYSIQISGLGMIPDH